MYQPAELGADVAAPPIAGGVLSIEMPPTVVVDELPTRSVARPVTDWFVPSVETVVSLSQVAMPDSASLQSKWTVTGPRYQPLAFGAVVGAPVITGRPLSIGTVTSPLAPLGLLRKCSVCTPEPVTTIGWPDA